MEIVEIHYTVSLGELLEDLYTVDLLGSGLKNNVVALLGDRPSGEYD